MNRATHRVLPPDLIERLRGMGLDPQDVTQVAAAALDEDLGGGADVTTESTIAAGAQGTAHLIARGEGVVAGLPIAEAVFYVAASHAPEAVAGGEDSAQPFRLHRLRGDDPPGPPASGREPLTADVEFADSRISVRYFATDGDRVRGGDRLLTVAGPTRTLLTAERTALNLACHLSGIATLTRRWVDAVAGTGAKIRDTRKTLPGLRALQKYAVRCGGGVNHRMSLSDAALVKDNHLAAAGSITAAFAAVSAAAPGLPIEIECDTLAQVKEAVEAGATLILLDNFAVAEMTAAVTLVAGRARLEASGGLTLQRAREVAGTGVDYLAVGALTHSAPALDIALDLAPGATRR
jgi:nicotinate-nucleotide pyrophosphorylase (carboxylating)